MNSGAVTASTPAIDGIARELRVLADVLVANEASSDDIASVIDLLSAARVILERAPHGSIYRALSPGMSVSSSMGKALAPTREASSVPASLPNGAPPAEFPHAFGDHPFRRFSPVIGSANPVAPPAVFGWDGDRVVGQCTFGARFEGAPGCVHGGFVAAVFDEALGIAQGLTGAPGMTAYLNVQYRKPHRLHRPIRFEAGVASVDGRKIRCTGSSFDAETGELLAECEALFISIDWEKIRAAAATEAAG